jgi:hypothetical protein
MVDQTTTKPMGLIRDLKIYVHRIPYVTMFIMLQNNVIDVNYSTLLGRPWLRGGKIAHDFGNNIMTIQVNETVRTMVVIKLLGAKVKQPKVLL